MTTFDEFQRVYNHAPTEDMALIACFAMLLAAERETADVRTAIAPRGSETEMPLAEVVALRLAISLSITGPLRAKLAEVEQLADLRLSALRHLPKLLMVADRMRLLLEASEDDGVPYDVYLEACASACKAYDALGVNRNDPTALQHLGIDVPTWAAEAFARADTKLVEQTPAAEQPAVEPAVEPTVDIVALLSEDGVSVVRDDKGKISSVAFRRLLSDQELSAAEHFVSAQHSVPVMHQRGYASCAQCRQDTAVLQFVPASPTPTPTPAPPAPRVITSEEVINALMTSASCLRDELDAERARSERMARVINVADMMRSSPSDERRDRWDVEYDSARAKVEKP